MSKLIDFLLKVCLVTTSSKCIFGSQIGRSVNVDYEAAITPDIAEDNVVTVTNDTWTEISHASSLDDLNTILGISANISSSHGTEASLRSAFRQADFTDGPKFRNVQTDRYIENADLTICTPEIRVVELDLPTELGIKHYPKCVKVQRCGGCCNDVARECKAIESRKVHVKVIRLTTLSVLYQNAALRRRGARRERRRRREQESVQVDSFNSTLVEHTKCGCQCRVLETDCNLLLQQYNPQSCSCVCKNKDKMKKCMNDHLRYWSEETCDCKCRKGSSSQCSTGKYFNEETCQCEINKISSNFDDYLRKAEERLQDGFSRILPSWRPQ